MAINPALRTTLRILEYPCSADDAPTWYQARGDRAEPWVPPNPSLIVGTVTQIDFSYTLHSRVRYRYENRNISLPGHCWWGVWPELPSPGETRAGVMLTGGEPNDNTGVMIYAKHQCASLHQSAGPFDGVIDFAGLSGQDSGWLPSTVTTGVVSTTNTDSIRQVAELGLICYASVSHVWYAVTGGWALSFDSSAGAEFIIDFHDFS